MEITAKVDQLTVASSGIVLIEKTKPLLIKAGALNIRFELSDINETECKVERVADESSLTLKFKAGGKIPNAPFTFFSTKPQKIGTSGGVPVFFYWQIARPHPTEETIQIHYTVFTGEVTEAKEPVSGS